MQSTGSYKKTYIDFFYAICLTTPADVGDHVVVINTKHVAMVEDLWRKQQYKHDTRFVDNYISQYRQYSDI